MKVLAAKQSLVAVALVLGILGVAHRAAAQTPTPAVAPTVIPVSGQFLTANGQPRTGAALLVISLYEGQNDPAPRWIEHQQVTLDAQGRYSVEFGSTQTEGLPADLFTGAASMRWIGVAIENEAEQPRVMLVSVPYAAKAAAAETLAGRTASDFVLASTFREDVRAVLTDEGVSTSDVEPMATNQNFVAKFQDNLGTLTDSTLFDTGSGIGIGTTSPIGFLHLRRGASGAIPNVSSRDFVLENSADAGVSILTPNGNTGTLYFGSTSDNRAAKLQFTYNLGLLQFGTDMPGGATAMLYGDGNEGMRLTSSGRVGIGTTSPNAALDVRSAISIGDNAAAAGALRFPNNTSIRFRNAANNADVQVLEVTSGNAINLGPDWLTIRDGNVGVGITNPTSKLHVAGTATFASDVTVNGNIAAKYQDVAEWVDAAEPLEAGTLVVIDTTATNRVLAAKSAYDGRVAGAVSPQPGLILGEPREGGVLVAQSGRVKVKADATFGAIKPGDLLVSSPTKGHVMRSKPVKIGGTLVHRPGTVVGKALEALPGGKGEILVLLTLQ